jgi:hypothetical protein
LKPTHLVEDTTITQDSTVFKHSVENMTNKSAKVEGYEKEDENLTEIGKSDISSKASVVQNLHRSNNCSAMEIENKTDIVSSTRCVGFKPLSVPVELLVTFCLELISSSIADFSNVNFSPTFSGDILAELVPSDVVLFSLHLISGLATLTEKKLAIQH